MSIAHLLSSLFLIFKICDGICATLTHLLFCATPRSSVCCFWVCFVFVVFIARSLLDFNLFFLIMIRVSVSFRLINYNFLFLFKEKKDRWFMFNSNLRCDYKLALRYILTFCFLFFKQMATIYVGKNKNSDFVSVPLPIPWAPWMIVLENWNCYMLDSSLRFVLDMG